MRAHKLTFDRRPAFYLVLIDLIRTAVFCSIPELENLGFEAIEWENYFRVLKRSPFPSLSFHFDLPLGATDTVCHQLSFLCTYFHYYSTGLRNICPMIPNVTKQEICVMVKLDWIFIIIRLSAF